MTKTHTLCNANWPTVTCSGLGECILLSDYGMNDTYGCICNDGWSSTDDIVTGPFEDCDLYSQVIWSLALISLVLAISSATLMCYSMVQASMHKRHIISLFIFGYDRNKPKDTLQDIQALRCYDTVFSNIALGSFNAFRVFTNLRTGQHILPSIVYGIAVTSIFNMFLSRLRLMVLISSNHTNSKKNNRKVFVTLRYAFILSSTCFVVPELLVINNPYGWSRAALVSASFGCIAFSVTLWQTDKMLTGLIDEATRMQGLTSKTLSCVQTQNSATTSTKPTTANSDKKLDVEDTQMKSLKVQLLQRRKEQRVLLGIIVLSSIAGLVWPFMRRKFCYSIHTCGVLGHASQLKENVEAIRKRRQVQSVSVGRTKQGKAAESSVLPFSSGVETAKT